MKDFLEKNVQKFKDFMKTNDVEKDLGMDKKKVWKFIGNYVNHFNAFENDEKALRVGGFFDLISALIKFFIGFLTGSMVILSSAIDCLADFFTSIFNIILYRWSKRPSDEKYNYGYGKLQGMGAVVQSGIIMLATIYLIFESIHKLFLKNYEIKYINLILIVIAFDIVLVLFNLAYHVHITRGSHNMIVKSSIMKSFTAFLMDIGILFSFIIIQYFTNPPFYKLDPIVSIFMAIFIIIGLYKVVTSGIDMLMDKSIDDEDIQQIDEIIKNSSNKIIDYKNFKSRKSGDNKFIDFDLVLQKDLNFDEVYYLCILVKDNISKSLENAYIMINPVPNE